MDESAQQAVQLGVNVTIFVVALTLSITLLLGVRDVASVASEYDASIPTGSRLVSVEDKTQRIVSGNELLSYYVNYMTDINHERTDRYVIYIQDGTSVLKETTRISNDEDYNDTINTITDIKQMFKNKGINLSKNYELVTEEYNKEDDILTVKFKSIETE